MKLIWTSDGNPSDYLIDIERVEFAIISHTEHLVKVQFQSEQIQEFRFVDEASAQKMYKTLLEALLLK